ncbi:MAG: hypothetical protein HY300_13105 [Verrucomicrobia bacterium]|nr:hypothetical protein [Verrucomicrobiota bacterium]
MSCTSRSRGATVHGGAGKVRRLSERVGLLQRGLLLGMAGDQQVARVAHAHEVQHHVAVEHTLPVRELREVAPGAFQQRRTRPPDLAKPRQLRRDVEARLAPRDVMRLEPGRKLVLLLDKLGE